MTDLEALYEHSLARFNAKETNGKYYRHLNDPGLVAAINHYFGGEATLEEMGKITQYLESYVEHWLIDQWNSVPGVEAEGARKQRWSLWISTIRELKEKQVEILGEIAGTLEEAKERRKKLYEKLEGAIHVCWSKLDIDPF